MWLYYVLALSVCMNIVAFFFIIPEKNDRLARQMEYINYLASKFSDLYSDIQNGMVELKKMIDGIK